MTGSPWARLQVRALPRLPVEHAQLRHRLVLGLEHHLDGRSETDAGLAQKLGQLQPFIAVFPQERTGQLASFGPT